MEKPKRVQKPWTEQARKNHAEGIKRYQEERRRIALYPLAQQVIKICNEYGYDLKTFLLAINDERFSCKGTTPEHIEKFHSFIRTYHLETGVALK